MPLLLWKVEYILVMSIYPIWSGLAKTISCGYPRIVLDIKGSYFSPDPDIPLTDP